MPTMAVLDDRQELLKTLMRSLKTALPKDWDCIECPLLPDRTQYPNWLSHHNVDVLVADQVLNEQASGRAGTANYKGDEVSRAVHRAMPNFPIFIVTAFPDDNELNQHLADVEYVATRKDLTKNVRQFVPRMVRSGQRFHKELARSMERVSELAVRVASGRANATDRRELRQLQATCGMPSAVSVDGSRESRLSRAEAKLDGLGELCANIEKLIKRRRRQ